MSNVVRVGAGPEYSFFETETGQFYACGRNDYGQLASDDFDAQWIPQPVTALNQLINHQSGGHPRRTGKEKEDENRPCFKARWAG